MFSSKVTKSMDQQTESEKKNEKKNERKSGKKDERKSGKKNEKKNEKKDEKKDERKNEKKSGKQSGKKSGKTSASFLQAESEVRGSNESTESTKPWLCAECYAIMVFEPSKLLFFCAINRALRCGKTLKREICGGRRETKWDASLEKQNGCKPG